MILSRADLSPELRCPPSMAPRDRRARAVTQILLLLAQRARALLGLDLRQLPPAWHRRLGQALIAFRQRARAAYWFFGDGLIEAEQREEQDRMAQLRHEQQQQARQDRMVYLGAEQRPESYALIGWRIKDGDRVALSRDGGQFILLVGHMGSGKSQSGTCMAEGVLRPLPGINSDRHRETGVISFSYTPDGRRLPDILEALRPNGSLTDQAFLREHFEAQAQPIERMRLIIPKWLMPQYEPQLRPFLDLGLQVSPLRVRLPQLGISGIETLVGGDETADYIQTMLDKAQQLGEDLRLSDWRQVIDDARELTNDQKRRAHARLSLLGKICEDDADLWDLVQPGEYSHFVMGGRWIREQESLPLIMSLMNSLNQPSRRHGPFQRFFQLDESNYFDGEPKVMKHLLTTGRLIRHSGGILSMCVQDALGLEDEMLALTTMLVVFRLESPIVLEDLKRRRGGLERWSFGDIRAQEPGCGVVTVAHSTDPEWTRRAQQMQFRPLLCQHGGYTKSTI